MRWRSFLGTITTVIVLSLVLSSGVALAANPAGQSLNYKGRPTVAEREAASDNFQQQFQSALAAGTITATQAPDPGGMPHYFGPYPNWANSSLPKGVVANLTVMSGGTGYTTATVQITDLYYGTNVVQATATATITGGVVTGIVLNTPGSGYSAPVVTITGNGSGAMAMATIGPPFTGGIRKFVDSLPGLNTANNLGQTIAVAVADRTTYPTSDYYEIGLVQYSEKMHSDLPPTTLRGYVQLNDPAHPVTRNPSTGQIIAWPQPSYLGPMIVAQRDRPVRVKFTNLLPTGTGGNLFIPVDTTVMGAGMGPNGGTEVYKQNRATLHLHGGITPWISDGTPHQWTTPAGEVTSYPTGVSVQNVPDMPNPGPGSLTFFYTNQQSARLMFYHDHAYGITRLNVYAGEAAGYLVEDPVEQTLVNGGTIPYTTVTVSAGTIPTTQVPLVIQDKTFVDASTIGWQDPTWNWGTGIRGLNGKITTTVSGDLWFPHVYMPNQNPYTMDGTNAMGRWDYGPWFWPPYTGLMNGPVPNPYAGTTPMETPVNPGIPNPTIVPEAFMDTSVVNGTVYPYLNVDPKAYRLRILNAGNDRTLNLQLYQADPTVTTSDGRANTEVKMVTAAPNTGLPPSWPTDGRDGGVPDPTLVGPSMIQIGNEGGFLPAPVVLPNTPVGYNYNRRDITVLNVSNKTLMLGPAERADVIVDFSAFAGKTIILYNDAPAPVPAFDPRIDYYTGGPDLTSMGGAPSTQVGYGPNTRTIMQFRVSATASSPAFNLAPLQTALPAAFAASQPAPIVPQAAYNAAYHANFPLDAFARIQSTSLSFIPVGSTTTVTMPLQPKAIQELFEPNYGRMNATLGVEIPNTNAAIQTTIPYGYIDPATEILMNSNPMTLVGTATDGTQIWKITHNGVDTHAIHVHMFNMQLINRVGWDGMVKPPDPNEVGWKETVRMNPLEDAIVAVRPIIPTLPFQLPNSVRAMDVTQSIGAGMGFMNIDPNGNPVTVTNQLVNYGWEYVWHCHLLGHEENDMMRPMIVAVAPNAPSNLTATASAGPKVILSWKNNALNATGFTLQRATDAGFTTNSATIPVNLVTTYTDTGVTSGVTYYYRVIANNVVGGVAPGYPSASANSAPSNTATAVVAIPITLHLQAGWNLVSVPAVTNSSPNVVFAGLPAGWNLYRWDPVNNLYTTRGNTVLQIGMGFWLNVPTAVNYSVVGTPYAPNSLQIPLTRGQNMVGIPYPVNISWTAAQFLYGGTTYSLNQAIANGWMGSGVYNWTGTGYANARITGYFAPTVGYWVQSYVNGASLVFNRP